MFLFSLLLSLKTWASSEFKNAEGRRCGAQWGGKPNQIKPCAEQWGAEGWPISFWGCTSAWLQVGSGERGLAEFRKCNCWASKTAVLLRRECGEEHEADALAKIVGFQGQVEFELLVSYQCYSNQRDLVLQWIFGNVCRHFCCLTRERGEIVTSGRRPGMLLNTHSASLLPQQRIIWPKYSILLRLKNPGLDKGLSEQVSYYV